MLKLNKQRHRLLAWFCLSFVIIGSVALSFLWQSGNLTFAAQNTYYVALNGDDNNPGTIDQPFRHINTGIQALSPGDTLYIRGGTYTEGGYYNGGPEGVFVNEEYSGTPGNHTTISGYPGEEVVIDGQFADFTDWSLVTVRAGYLDLENLEIAHSKGRGIQTYRPGADYTNTLITNVNLRNLKIHHTVDAGVFTEFTKDITIENNEIWQTNLVNDPQSEYYAYGNIGMWSGAIHARRGSNFIIRENTVYESYGEGINIHGGADGVLIQGNTVYDTWAPAIYPINSKNIIVNGNLAYHTNDSRFLRGQNPTQGIMLGDEEVHMLEHGMTLEGVQVTNNLVKGFQVNVGFWFNGFNSESALRDVLIANNTLVDAHSNVSSPLNYAIWIQDTQGGQHNAQIKNNIIFQNDNSAGLAYVGSFDGTLVFENNLWSSTPEDGDATGIGDIVADPLLLQSGSTGPGQLTGEYFQLQSSSPAIDQGVAVAGVMEDYFGQTRNNQLDIGAVEYQQEATVGSTYYVSSTGGNDNNTGLGASEAWQTLDHVSAQTFNPGDTILFACGETFSSAQEYLTINGSGTAIESITISSYPSNCANPSVLENTNDTVNYSVIFRISGDYWNIENIHLAGSDPNNLTETAIALDGNYNTVNGVDISGTGFGVKIQGDNNTVTNSDIHDLVMLVNDSTPDNDYGVQGIIVAEANNTTITYNNFYSLRQPSQDYGEDGAAVEFYRNVDNVEVAYNLIEDVEAFTEMGSDNSADTISNVTFHHNIVKNATTLGIFHNDGASAWSVNLQNILFDNNTFVRDMARSDGTTFWFASAPTSPVVSLRNNIFQYRHLDYWFGNIGVTVRQNNLYDLQNIYDGYGSDYTNPSYDLDSSELKGSAGFVDGSSGDFHLIAGSEAVDAGVDLDYSQDYDRETVPQGTAPEIGALEFVGQVLNPPTAQFTASQTSGEASLKVQFTDQSTENPASWQWDFDNDGTVDSTEQNPSYTYDTAGTYTVSLIVTNDNGIHEEVKTDYITVTAAIQANQPPILANDSVTTDENTSVEVDVLANDSDSDGFLDKVNLIITSNPANGTAQIIINNNEAYLVYLPNQDFVGTDTLTYQVCDDGSACSTATLTIEVQEVVGSNQNPAINLISPTDGQIFVEGDPIMFTAVASDFDGQVVDVEFFAGGVLLGQASENNGNWTLALIDLPVGIYQIAAQATDNDGATTFSASFEITIEPAPQPPVAEFSADPVFGLSPLTVQFTDQSTENPASWQWDFDNDGTVDSTEQNPSFVYESTGIYTVSLTATNEIGSGEEIKVYYITVIEPNQPEEEVIYSDDLITEENQDLNIPIDDAQDWDWATFEVVSGPANGELIWENQTLTYSPALDFTGSDSFAYRLCLNEGQCYVFYQEVEVTPAQDPEGGEEENNANNQNNNFTNNQTNNNQSGPSDILPVTGGYGLSVMLLLAVGLVGIAWGLWKFRRRNDWKLD